MARKVSLVVSDVDGTLVTPQKRLTGATIEAVARLAERGIHFTVASSRPPFGLKMLVGPLALKLPMGAFNGGCIVGPALDVVEEHVIPGAAAERVVDTLEARGVDVWLFTVDSWLVRDAAGVNVARESATVAAVPQVVARFGPMVRRAVKIVGVSNDCEHLARCESELRARVAGAASVARSQRYYLDVTPPGVSKGTVVEHLAARLGVPREEIVTIGDMANDVAMFERSGMAIAMGNADDDVKARATVVTADNADDGFAKAVLRYVLPAVS